MDDAAAPTSTDAPEDVDDGASDASSSGLPPPLLGGEEYESFVCAGCVRRSPLLQRWAGTLGAMMVVRDSPNEAWRRLNGGVVDVDESVDIEESNQGSTSSGVKRPRSPTPDDGPDAKRVKTDGNVGSGSPKPTAPCLAPVQPPLARTVMASLVAEGSISESGLGAGDVFLTEGFRERWCHCPTVSFCPPLLKGLTNFSFLSVK